jgi:sterol desaturase/sphingolipid hydroxylase (fatty acid hydroxylase superfamily)
MMTLLCALGGAFGWSLTEYLMHRFNGHEMRGKTRFSREHLAHHAKPDQFAPTSHKLALASVVLLVIGAIATGLIGLHLGLAFTVGFGIAYAGYEWLHRRLHTHAPQGAYGRWARRHHFAHHFTNPNENHGVTSPLWDWVFGTLTESDAAVRVPRRHAPVWMVDPAGVLQRSFSDDYVLAGRTRGA